MNAVSLARGESAPQPRCGAHERFARLIDRPSANGPCKQAVRLGVLLPAPDLIALGLWARGQNVRRIADGVRECAEADPRGLYAMEGAQQFQNPAVVIRVGDWLLKVLRSAEPRSFHSDDKRRAWTPHGVSRRECITARRSSWRQAPMGRR